MIRAEVLIGGIFGEIGGKDIDGASGRVDVAAEDIVDDGESALAHLADPKDGVHFQLAAHHGRELHGRGALADQHDLVADALGSGDGRLFVGRQCQRMRRAVGIAVVLFIRTLLPGPADEHEADAAVRLHVVVQRTWVFIHDVVAAEHGTRARRRQRAGRLQNALGRARLFHLFHGGIVDRKRFAQRLGGGDLVADHPLRRTAARHLAIDGANIAVAERLHRTVFGKRQDTVVLQEDHALLHDLIGDLEGMLFGLFFRFAVRPVIVEVPVFRPFGDNDVPLAPAHELIESRAQHVRHHCHHDRQHQQNAEDGDHNGTEALVAHFFHFLCSLYFFIAGALPPDDGSMITQRREKNHIFLPLCHLFFPDCSRQRDGDI